MLHGRGMKFKIMKKLIDYKIIIFDFDGVILNSMPVRDEGFKLIFRDYPNDKVEELLLYHNKNGGLSRFNKIEYFYTQILKKPISKDKIYEYADRFSEEMRQELTKPKYRIEDAFEFIRRSDSEMHIASGSEEKELQYLCKEHGIDKYFKSINGSPTAKNEIVKNIINMNNYNRAEVALVGDSVNDYEACQVNHIEFFGYNNYKLKGTANNYIEQLS